jgi:hypothetical protein
MNQLRKKILLPLAVPEIHSEPEEEKRRVTL